MPLKPTAMMMQQLPDAGQTPQEGPEREDIQIRPAGLRAQGGILTETDLPDRLLQDPSDLQETGTPPVVDQSIEALGNNQTETDLPDKM